ncbi:uncharacterized protein LOC144918280 isoform X2 [Branchiostoma floridae x Branchiostoma belcheri]
MKGMHLKFFTLVFLGLCSSGVTDTDADTDGEMEDTEGTDLVTEDADEDTEGTDGDTGDAGEDTKDTDGDTEDADGDNEGTDGDTEDANGDNEDANGDTEGTDGDTGDANGDTEGTDGDTGDADGDTEGTDGDTGDANGDTEGTDGDTEDADGDNEGTDGDTEDANGDNEDANGDTEGTGGDTGDANGDTEGTDGDTRDADVSSTGATEKRGQDAEDLENLKRGRGASADELSFQSRRQNSVVPGDSQKIIFPGPRSIDDYARMETTLSEDLTSFTLCVHMRSNLVSSMISLVSYAVPEHSNELLFYGFKGGFTLHIQSKIQMADLPVWDGEWHTICTTWRSSDGAWQLYNDGVLRDSGSGFKVGGRVRRGGTWILGQDQDEVGGGFNAKQAFTGELSEVNLWDRVLSPAEIAADCSYHGNVIDWDTTNIAVFGQTSRAEYHQCARARAPVSELSGDSQKIIFPGPRSIDDYARMETTLSEDLTSFTLCVHMRSNLVSSMISLVSYAVPEHSNELLLFGFKGGFTLHIQSKIQMADLPVWDGEWHTICTTWRSSDGSWQLYTDGVLRDSGSGFKVGGRVRRGGTWILGQDQDEVGGGFNAKQAFTGELSEVNLWDRVLSPAEIAADCSYHGNVIDWDTTNIAVFGQTSRAEYHQCARARAPVSELSASTTCSNDYMELSIPEDQLTDIDLNNLHWRPDRNCGATTNGTHYLFRTELYDCGTEVTFGAKYVTFLNTIDIVGTHLNSGVITREGNIWITSKCNYERKEWVDSTFLPIPGGLNFTEEGFGQLEVRLSMFPTRQYQRQYRADQYPIHLRLRQHVYMQLEVQGHGQKLSVLALNCKATMSPSLNDSLQYQLIRDGCASDPTLKTYDVDDPGKERFGFEAFRFIREVGTVYVHCEVLVCDAADAGSRCAQGCVRRGKRAAGEVDMRGRHMIYQGPIVLDDDKEAEHAVRLVDDQETGPARRGAPWAMLAAGCVLAALALVVLGAAIVQKRSRRGEWAYHGLKDGE